MKKLFLGCFLLVFVVASTFGDEKPSAPIPYGKYKVGDEGPGGGIIFYTSEKGFTVHDGRGGKQVCHYLEMTQQVLERSQWIPYYAKAGGTETGLGYGKANTYKILRLRAKFAFLNKENCAAAACSLYSTSTTKPGEWFLPSKDEQALMRAALNAKVVATSEDGSPPWYWTSSETKYDNMAYLTHFYDNDGGDDSDEDDDYETGEDDPAVKKDNSETYAKVSYCQVRPVRAF